MNGLSIYSEANVEIPRPELYVVFTGERNERPETISLRECFFCGEGGCVDVAAKVIYDSRQGDILNQYIVFSRVFDEQRKLYPSDRAKAVLETIRICRERDVLKTYLMKEEAAAVMFTLADQEEAMQEALQMAAAEGEARGEAIGEAQGEIRGEHKLAALMDKLLSFGRLEDAKKAAKDELYRSQLFSEFNL